MIIKKNVNTIKLSNKNADDEFTHKRAVCYATTEELYQGGDLKTFAHILRKVIPTTLQHCSC